MEKLLTQINSPKDLKRLNTLQLTKLCKELREFIIDECSCNPGHFGASLGTIELTVALHYIYNTPEDKLIWDVGHQAYAHKIITGRRALFSTNRKYKGLSGFPKIEESKYDAFGSGHASTSISAGMGMATAFKLNNEKKDVVAIIGDGSMTGGLAYEGLNNAGGNKSNMLVVFNDNNMAIDPNVGAMKERFAKITSSGKYNKLKKDIWEGIGENKARLVLKRLADTVKSMFLKESNFFESLGFRYFGPIDGHNLELLVKTLRRLKNIEGPKLLHIVTQKGKGYPYAEKEQTEWHAPGTFDKNTGERSVSDNGDILRYQDVFGETIVELAFVNKDIVGITPAMVTGSSFNLMMEKIPDRVFDVGIAEAHAVTMSAGLAIAGKKPFCNIYSTFVQRAYDSIIHDVALQKLNVTFCLDRGGLVGEDGPTHHGAFDLAFLRLIPDMIISAPMNEIELRNLMYTAQLEDRGAFSIRYPRGKGVILDWRKNFEEIPIGKGRILTEGKNLAIISIGHVGNNVVEAIKECATNDYSILHCDIRFLKPIDEQILERISKEFTNVITVEDGTIIGGLGTAVAEYMATHHCNCKVTKLGIPDKFIEHGRIEELHAECGYDVNGIIEAINKIKNNK